MDNYGTHKAPRVQRWLARRPYYHVHFTPTSASWLNLVERFFGKITTQRIRRGTFRSMPALEHAITDYLEHHNKQPRPFVWTASADVILREIGGLCNRINETLHWQRSRCCRVSTANTCRHYRPPLRRNGNGLQTSSADLLTWH